MLIHYPRSACSVSALSALPLATARISSHLTWSIWHPLSPFFPTPALRTMARIHNKLLNKLKPTSGNVVNRPPLRSATCPLNWSIISSSTSIQHLDPATLCSVRLACKDLYEITLPQFGSTYVDGTIQTGLSAHSLDRLRTRG